ncbi:MULTISPECIES: nuclear transport factor 2 family protein [Lactobacillus]|uniref:nuclear transport factor 2 family protein n=1 Tax=Lactobacillus TaxID=1578 RepID=UPI000EEBA530|nr:MULTISPECIES: nuclear transport factor 2 family protein [Lactobacillus]MRM98522.1 nuclear transport factor 2 family protein [Lactobacillus taiwanensis]
MSLEELENKQAISEVINKFSALELDVDKQSELFTPDTHIEIFMDGNKVLEANGRQEMKEKFGTLTAEKSYHMNGQQVITLESAEKAIDLHYCKATLIAKDKEGNTTITTNYIRYTDTLVKQEGKWLISNRHQEFVITDTRPFNA